MSLEPKGSSLSDRTFRTNFESESNALFLQAIITPFILFFVLTFGADAVNIVVTAEHFEVGALSTFLENTVGGINSNILDTAALDTSDMKMVVGDEVVTPLFTADIDGSNLAFPMEEIEVAVYGAQAYPGELLSHLGVYFIRGGMAFVAHEFIEDDLSLFGISCFCAHVIKNANRFY